jgi:hypothetical protein
MSSKEPISQVHLLHVQSKLTAVLRTLHQYSHLILTATLQHAEKKRHSNPDAVILTKACLQGGSWLMSKGLIHLIYFPILEVFTNP